MKKIFNITMFILVIALAVVLSLLPGVDALQSEFIETTGCIKSIKKETVVLISNNGLNGEITSRNNKKNPIYTNSSPLILASQTVGNLFNNEQVKINSSYDYDLSIDKQNIHQIRAP